MCDQPLPGVFHENGTDLFFVQTSARAGIQTQDLPHHDHNVTIDALDHLAMKIGYGLLFKFDFLNKSGPKKINIFLLNSSIKKTGLNHSRFCYRSSYQLRTVL